jgi:cytochrome P450
LKLLLWLKPRGLDRLFGLITPPAVRRYNEFIHSSVTNRIALQKEQSKKPEEERRQDMFYFLYEAQDPDTGHPAYNEDDLRAESNLLIIAGSDTTAISLSGIFFYITGDPWRYQKLVDEILTTFDSPEEIVHGPKLLNCKYLKACVDEGMRLTPPGPSEVPREVLPGGIQIKGEYYPAGTIVSTVNWATSRNQEVYGDPEVFRPERWIVDESTCVTKEEVSRIRVNFHPFLTGPGNCIGKNLATMEILLIVARTLYRLDVRRSPGSTLGCGAPELGWGARDRRQLQLGDAYLSLRHGPEVQFRRRASALSEIKVCLG